MCPAIQPPMAQRELSFIHSRAPRAAGLSDKVVDEHKELVHDLYLTQNYTRDQVINYLKTNLGFSLSPDQFSKAIRRWGFRKQPRRGSCIEQPPHDTAGQCTSSDSTSVDDLTDHEPMVTDESSKRPRSVASSITRRSGITTLGPSSPLPHRPVKRPKPRSDPGDTTVGSPVHIALNFATDSDFIFTPSAEAESTHSSPLDQCMNDDELSAEYLACCYRYSKAFSYYCKISIPFRQKTSSANERRARMLDMARNAKTRKTREVVLVMMESELKISNDPLNRHGSSQFSPGQPEMCRRQSFLFHRHLAQIYSRRSDHTHQMQKHLDKARNFTAAYGPGSIDLWTLLRLLEGKKNHHVSQDLLDSLKWDEERLVPDMMACLDYCGMKLFQFDSFQQSDMAQRNRMNPTQMSDLALQRSSFHLWKKSSFLFTFLWKEMQLAQQAHSSWAQGLLDISATQFLMIVCRMIVHRSWSTYKPTEDLGEVEGSSFKPTPSHIRHCCHAIPSLLDDVVAMPGQIKREFVTQFVEHYSWCPPAACKGPLAQQIQTYQMEALESVLTTKRDSRSTTPTSIELREVTTLRTSTADSRHVSTDKEFLNWLAEQQQQLDSTGQRDTLIYIPGAKHPSSFNFSSIASYSTTSISTHHIYLNALNGNPTISRSLASQSSRSSQVSVSSSLRRFKAAALKWTSQPESASAVRIYNFNKRRQCSTSEVFPELDNDLQAFTVSADGIFPLVVDDRSTPEEGGGAS
ncbi:hypothetical protein FSARC_12128 [Fusarium sarcochroum]|uniref:Clr5 domain-containing protein n=1 Tax=Fusarium sarcochroum TaxID=1208366 RepID=A0A8H4WYE1_9HYPO|nr:hypothetical protein FSARC_12128 [Fusarium sarcochroum]